MKNYTIFFNQTTFSITRFNPHNETLKENKNCYLFDVSLNFHQIISDFLSDNEDVTILYRDLYEENMIWKNIKDFFCFRRAAGGFVIKGNALLSIYRYEHWDFPKGHIEEGETDEEAAMREVTEETGIDNLFVFRDLGYSYHIYLHKNNFILKETHWYKMRTTSTATPIPQTEESILQAEWIPLKNMDKVIDNTYLGIKNVINRF